MGYREDFFKNTPSYMGKYQCQRCGNWFHKSEIDVDHRIQKDTVERMTYTIFRPCVNIVTEVKIQMLQVER